MLILGAGELLCSRVGQSVGPSAPAEEGHGNQRQTHLLGTQLGLSALTWRCSDWAQGYTGFTWEVLTLLTELDLQLHGNFVFKLINTHGSTVQVIMKLCIFFLSCYIQEQYANGVSYACFVSVLLVPIC